MGRARRIFRGRYNDSWLAPPASGAANQRTPPLRFEVGVHVYCKCKGGWPKGQVVALWKNPKERKRVYPYEIKLNDGRLIYAPVDDDRCINRVPRFDVGSYVQCLMCSMLVPASSDVKSDEDDIDGDREQWATGRVVAHHYEGNGLPLCPYQVQLQDGRLIYAPKDDDAIVKKAVFAVTSKEKSETLSNNQSANDRHVALSRAMTPMSMGKHVSCACGCLPREDHALMSAFWKLCSVVPEHAFVVLADNSDTDFKCAPSEVQLVGDQDVQNSDQEVATRIP